MAKLSLRHWRPVGLLLLLLATSARAEEALDRLGRRWQGRLLHDQGRWVFRAGQELLPCENLARIRFPDTAAAVPRTLLTTRLLLPHEQHVTGTLLGLDGQSVRFITSWGQTLTLPRSQICGLEPPDDLLLVLHESFESAPARSDVHAFTGKSSLLLDRAGQEVVTKFAQPVSVGRLSVCVYDAGAGQTLQAQIQPFWRNEATNVVVSLSAENYSISGATVTRGRLAAAQGWHCVQIDVAAEGWRAYVDDYLLGEGKLLEARELSGVALRCVAPAGLPGAAGSWWFDDLLLARKVAPRLRPVLVSGQDVLHLDRGEELFGRVLSADTKSVALEARYGKRSFSWADVRGLSCGASAPPKPVGAVEVRYRPGPGCSTDRLRVNLERWEKEVLVVRHAVFGAIRLERRCLQSVRYLSE